MVSARKVIKIIFGRVESLLVHRVVGARSHHVGVMEDFLISGILLNNITRGVMVAVGWRGSLLLQTGVNTFVDVTLGQTHGSIILSVQDVVIMVMRILEEASLASHWLITSHPGL